MAWYANQFEVGYNAFEFLFEFGQRFEDDRDATAAHTRIVVTPAYAKLLLGVLERALSDYEVTFGPIVEAPASPTGAGADDRAG